MRHPAESPLSGAYGAIVSSPSAARRNASHPPSFAAIGHYDSAAMSTTRLRTQQPEVRRGGTDSLHAWSITTGGAGTGDARGRPPRWLLACLVAVAPMERPIDDLLPLTKERTSRRRRPHVCNRYYDEHDEGEVPQPDPCRLICVLGPPEPPPPDNTEQDGRTNCDDHALRVKCHGHEITRRALVD